MAISRRTFLEVAVSTGAVLTASCSTKEEVTSAAKAGQQVIPAPKGEWIATTPASAYRPYRSKPARKADTPMWVQIDLGGSYPIDSVKVYPASGPFYLYPCVGFYAGEGFPLRFKIEASDHPDFHDAKVIVDHSDADFPNPGGAIQN